METLFLEHFGFTCAPTILITDILQIKRKTLFQLIGTTIDSSFNLLKSENLENIYDKNELYVKQFTSDLTCVAHKTYDFAFGHDFLHHKQSPNSLEIFDYEKCKNRFDEKIKNWKIMIESPAPSILIHFTMTNLIKTESISNLMEWLNAKKNNIKMLIFIIGNDEQNYASTSIKNVSFKRATLCVLHWWTLETETRINMYKEIYYAFLEYLNENEIKHTFPNDFYDTPGGKLFAV